MMDKINWTQNTKKKKKNGMEGNSFCSISGTPHIAVAWTSSNMEIVLDSNIHKQIQWWIKHEPPTKHGSKDEPNIVFM